jgi:hypothetical protein
VNRETVAFEYAFWDGTASVGMRLPFIQTNGAPLGSDQRLVGDLSILLKYAFYNDRSTGNVASAGMIITTPTAGSGNLTLADGSPLTLIDGSTLPNSVILQPWIGGVKMFDKGYIQGLTGFLVPLDNVEPIIFNKSFGAGYFLYQNPSDRLLTGIVPNIEVHARLPLNHRDPNQAIFFQDQVNLSAGVHFRTLNATLSPAINVPMVGPNPWTVEALVWLNCYF